jgi:hypothetical protein
VGLALSIPFHIAYLYYDFYADLNFHYRKYYSPVDEENLLTYLKDNPRALYQPPVSTQNPLIPLLEPTSFQPHSILVSDSKNPILRC